MSGPDWPPPGPGAPKSNAVYHGFGKAIDEVERSGSLPPPLVIRNAPTPLMKGLGYGAGYRYAHAEEGGSRTSSTCPTSWPGAASTSRRGKASRPRSRDG